MVNSGEIERISKGRFYKAKQGITGKLNPDEYEIVKDLLEDNNKTVGYLTGLSIFNRFGLTTQLSNIIQIGSNVDKKTMKRGKYTIKFIRQWNPIKKNNISQLQLLDCIRFIKENPDTSIDKSFERIYSQIKGLNEKDKKLLSKLAINYPPASRALMGALFENMKEDKFSDELLESLKSTTIFKINLSDSLIENKKKWKIQ